MMENTEVILPGDVGSTGRDASPQDATDDGYNSSGDLPRLTVTPPDSLRLLHRRPRTEPSTWDGLDRPGNP